MARQDLLHKTAPIVSVEPPINFASRFDGIADLQQARALQRGRLMAVVAAVLAASLTAVVLEGCRIVSPKYRISSLYSAEPWAVLAVSPLRRRLASLRDRIGFSYAQLPMPLTASEGRRAPSSSA